MQEAPPGGQHWNYVINASDTILWPKERSLVVFNISLTNPLSNADIYSGVVAEMQSWFGFRGEDIGTLEKVGKALLELYLVLSSSLDYKVN